MVSGGMGTTRLALGLSVILLCLAGSLLADVAPSRVDAGDQAQRSRRPIFRRDTCPGDPGDGKQCNSTSLQRSLTRADKDYDSGTYVGNNSMCLKLMKDEERHGTTAQLNSVEDQSVSTRRDTRVKARSVDRRTKRDTDRRLSFTDHTERTSSRAQTRRKTVQADRRRETEDPSTRRSHRTADARARSPDRTSAAGRRDVSSQERTRQSSRRVYSPERRAPLQDESSRVDRRQERREKSMRSSRNERRAITLERRSASLDSTWNQRASRTAEDRARSADWTSAGERRDLSVQERATQSSNRVFSAQRRSSSRDESSRFDRRVERRASEPDVIKYQPSSRTERRVATSERRSTSLDPIRSQRVSRTAENRARSLVEVRRNSVTERREPSRRMNYIERRASRQDDSIRIDRRVERRVSESDSIKSSRTERRVVNSGRRAQSPDSVRNQRASRTAEDRSQVEARRTSLIARRDSSRRILSLEKRVLPQDESSRVERRVERRISGSDSIKSQASTRTERREVTYERRMQSPVSVRTERASRTTRSLDRNSVTERRSVSTQERVRQSSRRVYSSERRATQDELSRVERRVESDSKRSQQSFRIERHVVASERRSASLDSVRNQRTSRTAENRTPSPVEVRRTSVTERRDVSAQERTRQSSRRVYSPERRLSPQGESTRVDRRVERRVSGPNSERRSASLDSVRNQRESRIERGVSFVERRTERRSVSSDSTTERSRHSSRVDAARTRVERRATYAERRDEDYRAERRIRSTAEETRTQRRITSGERRLKTDRRLSLSAEKVRSTVETARTRQTVRTDEDRRIVGLRTSRADAARTRETSRSLRRKSTTEQRTTPPTQTERNVERRKLSRDIRTIEARFSRLSSRRTPERTDSVRTREQSRAERRVSIVERRVQSSPENTRMDQSSSSDRRLKRSVSLGDERIVESLSRSSLTRRIKGESVRREDLRTSTQRREYGLDRRAARRSSLDSSRRSAEEAVAHRRAEVRERYSDSSRHFSETRRSSDQRRAQIELVRASDSTRQIRRILSDKSQRRVDGYDTLDRRSLRASRSVSQDRGNVKERERAASRESLYRRMVNILPQDRRVREVRQHLAENLQRRTITEARRLDGDRREISSRRTSLVKLSFNGLETEERRLQAASRRVERDSVEIKARRTREIAANRRETSLGLRSERQTTEMRRRSLPSARTASERRAHDLTERNSRRVSTVGPAGAWRRDARLERRTSEATRHADTRKSMSEAVRSSSLDRQNSLERRSRKSLDGLTRLEHRRDSSSDRARRFTGSERHLHTTSARRAVDVREDVRVHVTRAPDTSRRSAAVDARERMKISVKRSESSVRMSDKDWPASPTKSHRLEESVRIAATRRASQVDLARTTTNVKTEDNQLQAPALATLELKDNHVPDNYLPYVLAAILIGATIFYDSLLNSSLQVSLPDFDLPQPAMEEASKARYKGMELAGKRGCGGPLRTVLAGAGVASLRLF